MRPCRGLELEFVFVPVTGVGRAEPFYVEATRQQLIGRGAQASDVDVQPCGSFVTFSGPDGSTWPLQQLPPRG